MDVILLKTLDNLGKVGETVNVARGYARNYLMPRGLAVEASEGAAKMVADKIVLERKHDHRRQEEAEALAADLTAKDLTVVIEMLAGEEDRLYGSVAGPQIAEALSEQKSLEVDQKQLLLAEPIKELGEFEVPLKLHPEVEVIVKLHVRRSE